ncbi:MAG: hypothetical protein ACRDJC_20950, partial [Thermomicrobiales bacterium]
MRFVRVLYAVLILGAGAALLSVSPDTFGFVVLGAGLLVLLASFILEARLQRNAATARQMLIGMAGLFLGLLIAILTLFALESLLAVEVVGAPRTYLQAIYLIYIGMLGYLGLVAGQAVAREPTAAEIAEQQRPGTTRFLVGERGLIDGRAVRIAHSPLLAGEIVVPRYVVDGLQSMAASRNPVEHFRGERGLENLRALQQIPGRAVRIREIDVLAGETEGLLSFAREGDVRIVTHNPELLAEASRRGLPAVDLNQIADMLKPDVIQGDELVVKLVKPGKEREQAVGYLEDGNMVVVENAREDVGRMVRVVVTGIHQTRAGTLIFG